MKLEENIQVLFMELRTLLVFINKGVYFTVKFHLQGPDVLSSNSPAKRKCQF